MFCNFCQMEHTSASCFHPGRQALTALEQKVKVLEDRIQRAKEYNPLSARGCALCEYDNGVFIRFCSYCSQIAGLEFKIRMFDVTETREKIERLEKALAERDTLIEEMFMSQANVHMIPERYTVWDGFQKRFQLWRKK